MAIPPQLADAWSFLHTEVVWLHGRCGDLRRPLRSESRANRLAESGGANLLRDVAGHLAKRCATHPEQARGPSCHIQASKPNPRNVASRGVRTPGAPPRHQAEASTRGLSDGVRESEDSKKQGHRAF